jgi:Mg2+-importing ATPase
MPLINLSGLSSKEAEKRLNQFGKNIVFKRKRFRPLIHFLEKFNSPLLILLIFSSLILFLLGQNLNALIIVLMVFVSAVLDFINTYKSEKIIEDLLQKISNKVSVLRDNKKIEILISEVVPGDIVYLEAGDIVPADCLVLEADDFFVNQSTLTGESLPVEKYSVLKKELSEEDLNKIDFSLENKNLVFMSTSVVIGYAKVLVLRTGAQTEFGKLFEHIQIKEPEANFEINIKKFSFFMAKLIGFMTVFVFLSNTILGRGVLNSFVFAVAIAVGLTPELLPVIISVSLAYGAKKMSKKEVVIRNLSSIENFGSMNILCTDKTGTLTENRITLIKCIDSQGKESEEVLFYSYLSSIFRTSRKNPLDEAIKEHKKFDTSYFKKIDEIPFDFERKRDSIVAQNIKTNERILITKGAPEDIYKISKMNEKEKEQIQEEFEKLSADGFRVLAVAFKKIPVEDKNIYDVSYENDMNFLGFCAFFDPPKKTAGEAILELKNLGVEIKILTGDSEILTQKVCKELNLEIKGVLLGKEIENLKDEDLKIKAENTTIFARVTPTQKERIIQILKQKGNAVGYLGDGINDLGALKAADVGISVNNAVDVCKEVADIILLRHSLRVLKDGIIEGRKTFENTMKYIKMVFSSNFGNMFSMMFAPYFLPFLPMKPSQILLNNFLYDLSQTTIPTDNVSYKDIKKPVKWNFKELLFFMLVFGLISSIFDFITFFVLKSLSLSEEMFQTGWFIESLATQVFVIYIIRSKYFTFKSLPSFAVILGTFLVVVFSWILPYLTIGKYFYFEQLPFNILKIIITIVLSYLLIVELVKIIFYKNIIKSKHHEDDFRASQLE